MARSADALARITVDLAHLQMPAIERQVTEANGSNAVTFGVDDRLHRKLQLLSMSAATSQCAPGEFIDLSERQCCYRFGHDVSLL